MNIRDLKYVVAVADHQHFGKAAMACFVSQPTLSAQLKKLETELDLQIFERDNKQVLVTPIGQMIIDQARLILAEVETMRKMAIAASDPFAGSIKMGIIPTLGPYLLPHVIANLKHKLPKIDFFLYEDQTHRLTEDLNLGKLDVIILATPSADEKLAYLDLFEEHFYLAVHRNHPIGKKKQIQLTDIAHETILLLEEGHCLREQALAVCHLRGAKEASFRATSLETLRHMVATGIGMTVLPELAIQQYSKVDNLLTIIPFKEPKQSRKIAMFYRKNCARVACFKEIAAIIKQSVKHAVP
jgi:LysR family hydrogen peroxide-inducible transcriptional activator